MLQNVGTRKKLFLFPLVFIGIVVVFAGIYLHFSTIANTRNDVAVKTDQFIQQVLKGRISVYQFLRAPSQNTAQKVQADFELLNNNVSELKNRLTLNANRIVCDEIVQYSKEYVQNFDAFAKNKNY